MIRRLWAVAKILFAVPLLVVVLFCVNGLWPSWKDPDAGTTSAAPAMGRVREVRVLALNVAKCGFHRGGTTFASKDEVRSSLDRIADVIKRSGADLVALTEIVKDAPPCDVDQVVYLAEKTGLHAWAFAENYSFGIPFVNIRAGNALLSRFPMQADRCEQLAGGKPFWNPTNNRRILWCTVTINGEKVAVASLRNDSFDLVNNAVQAREIVESLPDGPVIIAGDFNADPDTESMQTYRETRRLIGAFDGPGTFPAHDPKRRIDYVLGPRAWTLVEDSVLDDLVSDHRAVLAVFSLR
ncbi:MAG: hypothetical protein CMJ83_11280 [Planctomycetes bacterium]|nr:hypothetical protein [Planctomycetota bacterium]